MILKRISYLLALLILAGLVYFRWFAPNAQPKVNGAPMVCVEIDSIGRIDDILYWYKAEVVSVYDGDTYTAQVDLGFQVFTEQNLRLLDYDTPELRGEERQAGLRVRDHVRSLLDGEVYVRTERDKTGKYGRYLAEVWFEREGRWVNLGKYLYENGMAEKYD